MTSRTTGTAEVFVLFDLRCAFGVGVSLCLPVMPSLPLTYTCPRPPPTQVSEWLILSWTFPAITSHSTTENKIHRGRAGFLNPRFADVYYAACVFFCNNVSSYMTKNGLPDRKHALFMSSVFGSSYSYKQPQLMKNVKSRTRTRLIHEHLEVWRWLSAGLLPRAVWQKFTDVSEVLTASIIRANRPDDGDSKQNSTRLHGATTQKTTTFILTAVRTWNFTWRDACESQQKWIIDIEDHSSKSSVE
jgi:hypothetical protein